MKKISVVGSLSYDLVMQVPRRPRQGETIIGTAFNTFVGGKGNNQALAAARSGAKVSMIGRVGKDSFGDEVQNKQEKTGIDTSCLFRDEEVGTGIADILIDANGENSIAIAPQANGRLCAADIDKALPVLKESSYVLMQLEIPVPTVLYAAKKAKELGLTVVLNPAPAPAEGSLPDELLSLVDIIIPNQTEAEILTGIQVRDIPSGIEAAKVLQKKGLKQVIITMGEMGALLIDENKPAHMCPPFEIKVLDTTAAGDAFCGALVAALAKGNELEAAMHYACAAGALATTKLGAEPSLPKAEEIQKLVDNRLANVNA